MLARLFLQVNGLTDMKELQQVILEAMGVISDTIDAKAPLAYQTYPEIAKRSCRTGRRAGRTAAFRIV